MPSGRPGTPLLLSGLRPRSTPPLLDVGLPTPDGREQLHVRHTEPDRDAAMLLKHLKLVLPPQPPPKITYRQKSQRCSPDLLET